MTVLTDKKEERDRKEIDNKVVSTREETKSQEEQVKLANLPMTNRTSKKKPRQVKLKIEEKELLQGRTGTWTRKIGDSFLMDI